MKGTVPRKDLPLPINSQGISDKWFTYSSLQGIDLKLDDMTSLVSYGRSEIFPGFKSCILSVWEWEVKAVRNFALCVCFHFRDELISTKVKGFIFSS